MIRLSVGKRVPEASAPSTSRRRRAGEPNRFVTPKSSIASNSLSGSTRAGRDAVHVRNDRSHRERGGEQRKKRKRAQIDLACLDLVESAERIHLRQEDRVRIDCSLGRPGAAAREQDRGRFVDRSRSNRSRGIGPPRKHGFPRGAQVIKCADRRPRDWRPAGADPDPTPYRSATPAEDSLRHDRLGYSDERVGCRLIAAVSQTLADRCRGRSRPGRRPL